MRDLCYLRFSNIDVWDYKITLICYWLVYYFGDFITIVLKLKFISEAGHTRMAKVYGCAIIVSCRAHALGSGHDIGRGESAVQVKRVYDKYLYCTSKCEIKPSG
jgi:hypothetical protein